MPFERIEVPIEIWHGEDDRVVSPEQSRILARTLPLVTEHLVPGEGHFSLFARHAEEVMQSLVGGSTTSRTPGFGPTLDRAPSTA